MYLAFLQCPTTDAKFFYTINVIVW